MYNLLITPFLDHEFMRKALVACLFLSLSFAPIGLILILRRMSLIGDSLSHAILPGAAIGFAYAGTSLIAMTIGGTVTGLIIVFLSTLITRSTGQKEDASFASFYIISTAIGIVIVTLNGQSKELMHLLFGDVFSTTAQSLLLAAVTVTVTLFTLAIIYRPLIAECFDPIFMKTIGIKSGVYYYVFLVLAVFNLVASFRALGTLMAVGLLLLPIAAARFWAVSLGRIMALGIGISWISSFGGLLLAYHHYVPSGPAIVLTAGVIYLFSVTLGTNNSFRKQLFRERHLRA